MREVRPGEFYRHFKDKLYQILTVAEHSETGERLVIYQALYGDYRAYARPYEMFVSEVDHEKYPLVKQKYRFEKVEFAVGKVEPVTEKEESSPEKVEAQAEPEAVKTVETPVPEVTAEEGEEQVNPILMEFLDAETLEEKLHIMTYRRGQMDDALLNSIAISLDLVVEKETVKAKYEEIMRCLSTMEHFECNRFR